MAILVLAFQRARSVSVAPVLRDYVVFSLSHQQPVAGHIWGPECRPLVIHVPAQIDDAIYAQFAFVVAEADSHGLPVSLTRSYSFSNPPPPAYPLTPPSYEAVPPGGVWLLADPKTPPRAPDGHPYRFEFAPVHTAVDGQQVVQYDVDTIHTQSFDAQPPLFWRQAMRVMIGYGWLIDRSTDPASGLAVDDANDAFTRGDVAALGYLSGCATH